jgi:integrase
MLGTISVRTVKALGPGEALWDAGHRSAVRGFGVRRQQDTATYVVKYRVFGRQRFVTIGKHGSGLTPERARREAKKLLGLVADGKDPAEAKAQARLEAADTLRKTTDQYLKHAKAKQRPRTYSELERYLLKVWKPLHSASVFKITRRQISDRLSKIAEAHGAVSAARARAALSAMFNWAIREGLEIPANPVTGTNRPAAPKSRERVLTDSELRAIWRASGDDDYGRIVRLLILTAQRRDEIGGLRWDEIATGVDGATLLPISAIRLPPERTKNHREHLLPLTPAALALLPPHRNDRDFVFGDGPRKSGDPHRGFSGWSKSKAALDKRILEARQKTAEEAGEDASEEKPLPAWTIHDLRRTAATIMADRLGVLPHIVEAILNHVSGHRAGVAGVYNRARYSDEMREALERWAREVSRIRRPKAVTLRRVVAATVGSAALSSP